jgi:hypothetical protein
MSGTDVNEKTFSLPESDGDIVRLFATGWQPRTVSFEVIQADSRIKITGKKNLEVLSKALFKFLIEERGKK